MGYKISSSNDSTAMMYSQMGLDAGMNTLKSLSETVVLPPIGSKHFVSQRHEVNPALALNLLNDIQSIVSAWHEQLRQIVDDLQALHAQGPMVDGWLQSSVARSQAVAKEVGVDSTILRHGDVDVLLRYVEALESASTNNLDASSPSSNKTNLHNVAEAASSKDSSDTGRESKAGVTTYRLCHMNDSGQVLSQPCPAEQMGMVSMAIARYQKFRQLTSQKQAIEAKLQRAVDDLTATRSVLRDSD